jgi:hypothetical protein
MQLSFQRLTIHFSDATLESSAVPSFRRVQNIRRHLPWPGPERARMIIAQTQTLHIPLA